MRKLAFFLILIAVVGACSCFAGPARKTKKIIIQPARTNVPNKPDKLVILYTSSASGQIRSCNCTKFRFGGYGREMTLLKSIRAHNPDSILIEGGDITGGNGFQAKLKAEVAAQAIKFLGYGAMVPGDEELGLRDEQAIKYFTRHKVPVICANLHISGDSKPVFKPWSVLITSNGLKVGVLGLLDKSIGGDFLERQYGQCISDPLKQAKRLVPIIRRQCDLLVVVFHGPFSFAGKLAGVNGIDIVLTTHRSERGLLFPPKGLNEIKAPVHQGSGATLIDAGTNDNWSLGQIDIRLNSSHKIAWAQHKLIYLDRRYPESPQMVKIYEAYNEAVTKAVLEESEKFAKKEEVLLLRRGLDPAAMRKRLYQSPFATSKACGDCHSEIVESWSKTRHANAINSLIHSRQEYDPECVACHVTGLVVRNGYINYKKTPELANVQCEACHGPALAHSKSSEAGFGKVGEQTCRSCHTEDRDPEFDFDTYWARIKH